jgi:hypothetical protein
LFYCGEALLSDAVYGVPLLGGGNTEHFRAAVSKAEDVYGLVTAPGALYVEMVRDPVAYRTRLLHETLVSVFVLALVSLCVSFVGGYVIQELAKYAARKRSPDVDKEWAHTGAN